MFNALKTTTAASLAVLSLFAAIPAKADALYFSFGDYGSRFGGYIGDGGRAYYRDDYRWHGRYCTPERALDKARRLGVHHARIDYVSRRQIGVAGHADGERVYMVFARAPRCPIIG